MRRDITAAILVISALFTLTQHADAQWSKAKITSRSLASPWVSTITATASYDNRHIAIDQKGNHWIYLIGDQTWYWRESNFPSDVIDAEWPSANVVVVLRRNGMLRAYRWPERTIQWEVDVRGTDRLSYNYGRYICYSESLVKVVHPTNLTVETTSWNKDVVTASYSPKGTIVVLQDGTMSTVQGDSITSTSITKVAPVMAAGIRGNVVAYASDREMGTLRMVGDSLDTLQFHWLPAGVRVERDEMLVTDSGTAVGTLIYDNTKYPLIMDAERTQRQNTWLRGDLRIPRAIAPRYVMLSWGYIFIIGSDASIRRLGYNTIDKSWVLNYQSVPNSGISVIHRHLRADGRLVSLVRCLPPYQPAESQSSAALLRHSLGDTVESWTVVPSSVSSQGRIVAVTDNNAILTSQGQTIEVDLDGMVTELFSDDPRCEHLRSYGDKLYSLYAPAVVSSDAARTWDSIPVPNEYAVGGFMLSDSMWAVRTLVDGKSGTSAWYMNRPNGEFVPIRIRTSPLSFHADLRGGERCLIIDWSSSEGVCHIFSEFMLNDKQGSPLNQYDYETYFAESLYKVHVGVMKDDKEIVVFDVDRAISPTRLRTVTYVADGPMSYDVVGLPVMEKARIVHAYKPHPLVVVITYDEGTEFTYDLRSSTSIVKKRVENDVAIRVSDDAQHIEIDADIHAAHVVDYIGQNVAHTIERSDVTSRITFGSRLRGGVYAVSFVLTNGTTQSAVFLCP